MFSFFGVLPQHLLVCMKNRDVEFFVASKRNFLGLDPALGLWQGREAVPREHFAKFDLNFESDQKAKTSQDF